MFKHLRNKFRKASKPAIILTASFFMAVNPIPIHAEKIMQPAFKTTSYWQYLDKDVTLKIVECRKHGLCLSIRDINPKDPRVKEFYNRLKDTKKSPDSISEKELYKFMCKYKFNTKLIKKKKNFWEGSVYTKAHGGGKADFSVKKQATENLTISFSPIFFINIKKELRQVPKPVNNCFPNKYKPK